MPCLVSGKKQGHYRSSPVGEEAGCFEVVLFPSDGGDGRQRRRQRAGVHAWVGGWGDEWARERVGRWVDLGHDLCRVLVFGHLAKSILFLTVFFFLFVSFFDISLFL